MQLIWGPVFLAVRESIWTKITQDDGLKKRTPYSLYGVGPQVKILKSYCGPLHFVISYNQYEHRYYYRCQSDGVNYIGVFEKFYGYRLKNGRNIARKELKEPPPCCVGRMYPLGRRLRRRERGARGDTPSRFFRFSNFFLLDP